jgi:hypothetical protein
MIGAIVAIGAVCDKVQREMGGKGINWGSGNRFRLDDVLGLVNGFGLARVLRRYDRFSSAGTFRMSQVNRFGLGIVLGWANRFGSGVTLGWGIWLIGLDWAAH